MIKLIENKKMIVGLLISTFGLVSCGGVAFEATLDSDVVKESTGQLFPFESKVENFSQSELLENTVTLNFQAFSSDNLAIPNLKKSDFLLLENEQTVSNYTLSSVSQTVSKADIVFVIDKTSSMGDEINGIKENVRNFVEQLKDVNILTNLCLVTFDDRVQDQCLEFQSDDPATAENENITDFLDRLERIEAQGGGDDPENQLAGLTSAANVTPWRPDSQRITIMITDESFSHTDNPGQAGGYAKSYPATLATLAAQRITNYIVGPSIAGYSSPFEGHAALTLISNYFDINNLIENRNEFTFEANPTPVTTVDEDKQNLGDILSEIASSLSTNYTLTYNINDNSLDTKLGVNDRNIVLTLPGVSGSSISLMPPIATYPNGHPEARSEWILNRQPDDLDSTFVYVNDTIVNKTNYTIANSRITFNEPPIFGSNIKVIYQTEQVSAGLTLSQLKIVKPAIDNYKIIVYYNNVLADGLDYTISDHSSGRYILLSVNPLAFDSSDKYLVKENNGLRVTFKIEQQNLSVE